MNSILTPEYLAQRVTVHRDFIQMHRNIADKLLVQLEEAGYQRRHQYRFRHVMMELTCGFHDVQARCWNEKLPPVLVSSAWSTFAIADSPEPYWAKYLNGW